MPIYIHIHITMNSLILFQLYTSVAEKSDLLSRNEPVQPYGFTQHSDAPDTHGTSSCLTHEPSAANEYELRSSGEKGTRM